MTTTTFVTGATGFIAQHLIKLLLSKDYKVVGTVRSEEKGKKLEKLFSSKNFRYEIVPDITVAGAFDEALEKNPDVSYVFHTASPVNFAAKDIENDLLKPAVEGTKNVLSSVKIHGKNVTKFVLTSSYVAAGVFPNLDYKDVLVNENSWSEISKEQSLSGTVLGYSASKTNAEKAAWEFVKTEKPPYKLSTILPSYVFGPQAFDSEVKDTLNFSAEILNQYLKLKPTDPLPELGGPFCDVRDVAKAHLIAAEKAEAANQRLLLVSGDFNNQLVAGLLKRDFPTLRDTIPEGDIEVGREQLKVRTREAVDTTKTDRILGFTQISLEKSLYDSIAQVIGQ